MGDYIGQNEAEKKGNVDNPVIIFVCKNHDYVVVDVQFQGRETEYDVIQEQFTFELVGSRIYVRPCAADHPQGAAYSDNPRKRPASPQNDMCEMSRVAKPKRNQENRSRSARSPPRSPSPSRRYIEKPPARYQDQPMPPCVTRNMRYDDSEERLAKSRRRQRANICDDSNSSFSSPPARRQPRQIKKENSMWNISKKEMDNGSLESSASLGDINNGSFQYCVQENNDGNYTFTERSKNIDRMKRERKNFAAQAGYDEDLCLKKLKQFCDGRNNNGKMQRNKAKERGMAGPKYDRYSFDLNDEEPRSNMKQYRNIKEKKCMFSCHQCCSDDAPSVVFEEFEMFASTETIRREPGIKDDDEDFKKSEGSKKVKIKNEKKEQASNEPEKRDELEDKGSKNKQQKRKKKDEKLVEKDKSKKDKTLESPILIEDSDDENEEHESLKQINLQPNNRPESPKRKEGRPGRSPSKSRLSPESANIKEEIKEERKSRSPSKTRLSPENTKIKEEKKEERRISARSGKSAESSDSGKKQGQKECNETSFGRNCCRNSLRYWKSHYNN